MSNPIFDRHVKQMPQAWRATPDVLKPLPGSPKDAGPWRVRCESVPESWQILDGHTPLIVIQGTTYRVVSVDRRGGYIEVEL